MCPPARGSVRAEARAGGGASRTPSMAPTEVVAELDRALRAVPGVSAVSVDPSLGPYFRATAFVAEHTMAVGERVHEVEGELAERWPGVQLDVRVRQIA
jgi:hypothetical protein